MRTTGSLLILVCILASCIPTPAPTVLPTPASPSTSVQVPALGDVTIRAADGMGMVYVPAGDFPMGSTGEHIEAVYGECAEYFQPGQLDHECPQHTVHVDGFWIDRTEVSNTQYRGCVQAGLCAPAGCEDDPELSNPSQPAVCVSWQDAQSYCSWAGARLPTEAEWEYAARGPGGNIYPWGGLFDGTRLNFCDSSCSFNNRDPEYNDGYGATALVGSYPHGVSWCGALDMAGNVWEWVGDWYASAYYSHSPMANPRGPASGERRVMRGGAWWSDRCWTRTTVRGMADPVNHPRINRWACGATRKPG